MHRLKLLSLLVIVTSWSTLARAQSTTRDLIRARALEMTDAVRTGQNDKIVDLMYPKVVEMAGGHDKVMSILKNMIEEMKQSRFKMESAEVGQPNDPVAGGDKLFSIVPQTVHVTGPNTKGQQDSYLLAISSDQGKTWYFLDGTGLTLINVKQLFPEFPTTLQLPARPKPRTTPVS